MNYKLSRYSPEQEAAFLKQYRNQIIVSGDSIPDVLIKFNELPIVFISH